MATACTRDDQPLLRQFLHQLIEALALLGAEQAFGRQLHVLEEQFGGVGGVQAELLELAAAAEAWRVVGLDHHQRDALGARLRIGLGDDDDQIGVLAVGDEGLGAVEHVAVAGLLRAWCARPAGRSRCRARSWRWRRPSRRSRASAASASSAPRCRNAECRARRCRNAAARRRCRSRRADSSRLITASCAKVPPAPPYSSGIEAQSRPACAGLGPDLARIHALLVPARRDAARIRRR